jgi:hypothetical protein
MTKLTGDTAISLSLVMVLCGVIWKVSVIKAVADTALGKAVNTEALMEKRREINDEFKSKVISDLAAIKERLGVGGDHK